MTDDTVARRLAILDAAAAVFLRYGYKKTSMDDLARAAGLSRQGLYLHFKTKEELFKAGVLYLLEATRAAGRAVLASELPADERVLKFFDAVHAPFVGELTGEHMDELMEAAAPVVGDAADELEAEQVEALAKLLRQSGVKHAGLSAHDLAANLFATSHGLKHSVRDREEYRRRMRVAVQLTFSGRT